MADAKNIAESLKFMPTGKIVALIAVVLLTVTALVLAWSWSQKPDYQMLYTNLSEDDAGQIIQKLTELRVPYTASSGGIMVPAEQVYELRLQLASQGLPQGGGVGFELFDKASFTMTDFVQKLNYRRALQGELARSVRSLAEVEQCRVHLAVPEKSLFVQKEERPKASILVKLRPGRRLSHGQVQGIVHLVGSSVEGLDPRDVSVIDSAGEMLTTAADEASGATGGQFEYRKSIEREIEGSVIGMLEPIVGKGKVRVKAAAAIDFTKTEKTEERFDPDSQVIRSEQRNVEKSSNSTKGGIPGVASNLPEKTQQKQGVPSGRESQVEKKNETVNYEITKVVSRIVLPSGEIKKLSVVALVDGIYSSAANDTAQKKYSPRPEEDLRQFEDMVKKAVGFSAERGDEVKVVNMPFEPAVQEDIVDAPPENAGMAPIALKASKYILPLTGMVLAFFFVVRPLMRSVTSSPVNRAEQIALPQTVSQLQRVLEARETNGREQIADWAKKNPREATSLVRGWLEEK